MNQGMRIKYQQQGILMVSYKIYSNGNRTARVIINTETKTYKIVDPITGFVQQSGGEGINNMEVLLRHAKKSLIAYLEVSFEKEIRNNE